MQRICRTAARVEPVQQQIVQNLNRKLEDMHREKQKLEADMQRFANNPERLEDIEQEYSIVNSNIQTILAKINNYQS